MCIHGVFVSLVAVLVLSENVLAQYDITNSTQSGGGGNSSGGTFALVGTIGQAVTGPIQGGAFQFLSGYLANECIVYEPTDLNLDGETNAADLGEFLLNWGECPSGTLGCSGDINYDSHIDAADLGLILLNWE